MRRAKEKIEEEPGVAAVEYDHAREASYTPADPGFPEQWGLKKTGFRSAWDAARGEGVRIAVVDSGVAAGHPDLAGKVVAQRDFVNGDGTADDDFGHGTHVAGIAAARTGNGTGVAGGCPGCELLVAKTMQGRIGYDSDVAQGIIWAADNGADVINLSLTGPAPSGVLERAVDYAWDKGSVVVAAAGNSGDGTVQYPGAYSNVIAVAAVDRSENRASFSTMGGWVDVAAPGVGVLSTLPGGYGYMNGTSMATPHVAALAGLLAEEGLSNQQIKHRIVSNTADLGPPAETPSSAPAA
ncbi:S8 family peptidase [Rubrobacter marinus]|uniref:S8 family peptidase n=1 Tax=Rubrobacter marinus TaxID=2653852 RepID=UPI00140C0DA4|nr:S8 family peptidase [Rubrobacter marinus]